MIKGLIDGTDILDVDEGTIKTNIDKITETDKKDLLRVSRIILPNHLLGAFYTSDLYSWLILFREIPKGGIIIYHYIQQRHV